MRRRAGRRAGSASASAASSPSPASPGYGRARWCRSRRPARRARRPCWHGCPAPRASRPAAPCRAPAPPHARCPVRDRRGRTRWMPFLRLPSRIALMKAAPDGLVSSSRPGLVETVWSCAENVRSGRRTGRAASATPEGVRRMQLMQHMAVDVDQLAAIGAARPDEPARSSRTRFGACRRS